MKKSFLPNFLVKAFLIITVLFIHVHITVQSAHAAQLLTDITVNTTLDSSQTYNLDSVVNVRSGVTLTIPAGTHLIFPAGSQMHVQGNWLLKEAPTIT